MKRCLFTARNLLDKVTLQRSDLCHELHIPKHSTPDAALELQISKASKTWWSTIMSGEGFVTLFTGPGTVFVQTRCLKALAGALIPYLPTVGGNGGGDVGGD